MRVTALELFAVPPRWLFLKLSTGEGIAGWGEPIVEGRVATTRGRGGAGRARDRPQDVAAAASEARAAGLTAVKMNACAEMHLWRNDDGTVAEW